MLPKISTMLFSDVAVQYVAEVALCQMLHCLKLNGIKLSDSQTIHKLA